MRTGCDRVDTGVAWRVNVPHARGVGFFVWGRARDAKHLKGVTLKRLPDEIVLDKESGKGKFEIHVDEPGYEDFRLRIEKNVDALPGDGVFSLRLELDDGTATEGWFIVHALASSASPQILSPVPSATLADRNPVLSWMPFRSPEYAAFEKRTLSMWLGREGDDKDAWSFWSGGPGADIRGVRIGMEEGGTKTTLAPGDYWLSLQANEERVFGPVRILRGSRTSQPLSIVR